MAHNLAAGDPRASMLPEFLAGPDPAVEAALFQNQVDGPPRWAPRRLRDGPRLRQSKVTSWALLPEFAEAVIDALEYDEDMAALGSVALDAEILALHGRSTPTRVVREVWSSRRPSPVVELPAAGGPPRGGSVANDPGLLMEGLRLGEEVEKSVLKAPTLHAAWVNPPDSVRSAIGPGRVPNGGPCPPVSAGSPPRGVVAGPPLGPVVTPKVTVPRQRRAGVKATLVPVAQALGFGRPSRFQALEVVETVPRLVAVGPRSHLDRAAKMPCPANVRVTRPRKAGGSPVVPDKDGADEWQWRSPGPADPLPARGTRYVLTPPPPPRPKEIGRAHA